MSDLPDYDELPPAPRGGRSAWGLFGSSDSIGLLTLQTPERVAAAARLVRTGQVFSLNAPLDAIDPPMFGRGALEHSVIPIGGNAAFDDKLDNYFPQASSQWDSLGHVAYDADQFYNGATADDIKTGSRDTVECWAERGIAGRAVLLDIETTLGGAGRGFEPASPRAITVDELEKTRLAAGITWQPGDVLLLHTGFLGWYRRQDTAVRERLAEPRQLAAVGLDRSEDMARYLWNAHIAAVASDNPSVEVWPIDVAPESMPFGFLHRILIGQFGMALGEFWWLEDLAESCRQDGRYEAFLTAAPTNVRGGIGSSANALAIK
jgi:kynurenine formamidase